MMYKAGGFTLVELMVCVAIIGLLATISVPAFINYRDQSMVAQVIGSSEAIRAAFASYAASSHDNTYPPTASIIDLPSLRAVVNENGGRIPSTTIFSLQHYDRFDSQGNNIEDNYSMRLIVDGVSPLRPGAQILITPSGIFKCTTAQDPC